MLHEHIELLEGALVEQQLDALARRELAAAVLRFDALVAAAEARRIAPLFETVDDMLHGTLALSFFSRDRRLFMGYRAECKSKNRRPSKWAAGRPSPAMKSADQSLLEPSRQRAISAGVNT